VAIPIDEQAGQGPVVLARVGDPPDDPEGVLDVGEQGLLGSRLELRLEELRRRLRGEEFPVVEEEGVQDGDVGLQRGVACFAAEVGSSLLRRGMGIYGWRGEGEGGVFHSVGGCGAGRHAC